MGMLVWLFCLVLVRVATFVAVVPLLGGTSLPRLVKAGLAVALTLFWFTPLTVNPAILAGAATISWPVCVLAIGRELFLGAVLGYGLGLFLVPVHIAGELVSQEMGLSFGNQVNPTTNASSGPLTQVFELLATALFFGVDGHHVLLGVLHGTFLQYPLGLTQFPKVPLSGLVTSASTAQEGGLLLAMPVGLCLFLTTIVLTLLTRAVPQMNLHAIGFPLRLGAGLAACLLLMPTWVAAVIASFGHVSDLVVQLL